MAEITEETVRHVAKIARLELTEEEIKKFSKQLSDVLNAFKEIDKVNIENTNPSFHPQEIKNVFREDEVKKWDWDPFSNTKHKEERYFKGPKIV